jgi:ubiquinone/menaquinone biosynthesis C-methylase UbiE
MSAAAFFIVSVSVLRLELHYIMIHRHETAWDSMMDYDKLADVYARTRGLSPIVLDELRTHWSGTPDSRVLEVGCGTGVYLVELVDSVKCLGWGVDPSAKMLQHAPAHENIRFAEGTAEKFPFEDSVFDLIFSVNVIHHVIETADYFGEAMGYLKPGGMICTVTDTPRIIRDRKPLTHYWPGTALADLVRYPEISKLSEQMGSEGFVDIEEHEISAPIQIDDPSSYKEKAYSCLHLISEDEFVEGLRCLEDDLKAGPVQGIIEFVCIWGTAPLHRAI